MTTNRAIGLLVVSVGFLAGVGQLFDNSFLTHLATGRLIWDGYGIPRSDPYTFTAAGEPWVVQSWFASVVYGAIDEVAGLGGLRLQFGLTTAALAGIAWTLTRPAGAVLARLLAITPYVLMGAFGWSHRPYLLGLLGLALALLAAQGGFDPRWLVAVGWVWLNTHGSWPLGIAALALLWLGRRLDGEDATVERRAAAWLAAGFLAGCLNPYGPKLLAFPLTAFSRREAFTGIREWQPPKFDTPEQLAFLVALALAVVALTMRPRWRAAIPLVVFTTAALLSARNLQVAALVFLPGTAAGLGSAIRGDVRVPPRPVVALAAALVVIGTVSLATTDDFGDEPYPVAADAWMTDHGLDPTQATVVTHDFVGNWYEARYSTDARVFIDDRVEVLPLQVIRDYATLQAGEPGWDEALARYNPDAVLWSSDEPLAAILEASDCWDVAHQDDQFVVALPVDGAGC